MDHGKARILMLKAIEEMAKSQPEHSDKPDPKVGAVLAEKDGTFFDSAYRGEHRNGDHAEYTLLDRKHKSEDLSAYVLFATLEPCTSRKHPKMSCADRILSARIKEVYVGMPDPNSDIHGKGISRLVDNGVVVHFFDPDLLEKIKSENKEFIEYFLTHTTEIDQRIEETSARTPLFENNVIISATVDDFSPDLIKTYLEKYRLNTIFSIPSVELWNYFWKRGFVSFDESKERYTPTTLGILFFCRQPQIFFPQVIVKMEVKYGIANKMDDLSGSLLDLPKIIDNYIKENIGKWTIISGFERNEKPQYPLEAIREAVVNALAHRDYSEGRHIHIFMDEDKFIVKSPGLPIRPLTLEKIRKYQATPFSRNPKIAELFSIMGYMEERGHGLKLMRDLLVDDGLDPPSFDYSDGYFIVKFRSQGFSNKRITIKDELLAKLSKRQKDLVSTLLKNDSITIKEYMQLSKITRPTASKDLKELVDLGIVEMHIGGRSHKYALKISDN